MRLLLVGNALFAGALRTGLDRLGHRCVAATPTEAAGLAASRGFSAAVVDCDEPGGREFLAELRKVSPGTPALAVAAEVDATTSVEVLRGGEAALALDYIEKTDENLLNRIDSALSGHFRFIQRDDFRVDLNKREAYYNDELLPLFDRELDLFIIFMRRPHRDMLYPDLAREVVGRLMSSEEAYDVLRTPMSRLRKALRAAAGREVLTRHNVKHGVRFVPVGRAPRSRP